jgi:hypothetical protein
VSRARATAIPKPQPLKRLALPLTSEVRQAVRGAPPPMASRITKPSQISAPKRPATATGRVAPKSLTKPTPAPHMPVRPATSASFRPQTVTTRPMRAPTKLQISATPLAVDPENFFGFEGMDFRGDDFMFDV